MSEPARSGDAGTAGKTAAPGFSDSGDIAIILRTIIKNMVTKSDLKAAVKTILRGEDATVSKTWHRKTTAKQQQIDAALEYWNSHAGCSLHNACIRTFVSLHNGYSSGKSMYRVMLRHKEAHSQLWPRRFPFS